MERGDDGGPRGTKAARLKDAHFIDVARSNRPLKYLAALFVSMAPAELTRPRQRESDKKFGKEKRKEKKRFAFGFFVFSVFSKFWNTFETVRKSFIRGTTFEVTTQIKVSDESYDTISGLHNLHVSVTSYIQQSRIFPRQYR